MDLFKKSIAVAVSVTPGLGLEVAQLDSATQTIVKYGVKKLDYNKSRFQIADFDLFKETLNDLLKELDIPKGATIYLNMPAIKFAVKDFAASFNEIQLMQAIEGNVREQGLFSTEDPIIDASRLPNSTMQSHKVAYAALPIQSVIEIVQIIQDLGYKVGAIDVSTNSVVNALLYRRCIDITQDTNWAIVIASETHCRVISMMGANYVDSFEERISIGEVLSEEENISAVISSIDPILQKLPTKLLCVVSETNIISAEALASKINYNAAIVYQEGNCYAKEPIVNVSQSVDENLARTMSLGLVGMSMYPDLEKVSSTRLNLFNASLGEIYLSQQPPVLNLLGNRYVLTTGFLLTMLIIFAILIAVITSALYFPKVQALKNYENEIKKLKAEQMQIQAYLKKHENISAELFDEGDEIRIGLAHNKTIYSYYSIIGSEIPKKLWLTHVNFSKNTTVEGQADNLQSIYAFYRSIKDFKENPKLKLEKLGLATHKGIKEFTEELVDTDSMLTSMNADFYEFVITDAPQVKANKQKKANNPMSGIELLETIE